MRVAVTSPIYVNNSLTKKYLDFATESIKSEKHDIMWIPCENYIHPNFEPLGYSFSSPISDTRIVHPEGEQCVSKAWNIGIIEAIKAGADYILVINDDIILKTNTIDSLVNFAVKHKEAVLWSATECRSITTFEKCIESEKFSECPSFSCFLVKSDFFKQVGMFDENFSPAYFEDNDMHARLSLSGKKAYGYKGAMFFHFVSETIKNDKRLRRKKFSTYPKLEKYFIEKWGHAVVNDVEVMRNVYYKHPYNELDKPLSYWRTPEKIINKPKIKDFIFETYCDFRYLVQTM